MRKLLTLSLLLFTLLGMLISNAEAARFGGGRSFGMQRSVSNFSRYQQPSRINPQSMATNPWMARLTGLAAGGLLAYLLMGHGLSSGLLSWLAIFGIGFIVWNLLRSRLQGATQRVQTGQFSKNNVFDAQSYFSRTNLNSTVNTTPSYPSGFDAEMFLRDAKVQFIRLQAAYDVKDLNDLREFTAPEVFGEIKMQLQERGQETNVTEVVSLNAELLDATSENQATLASVKFSGMIREASNTPAAPFEEAWHFRKDIMRDKWIVVGVQQ